VLARRFKDYPAVRCVRSALGAAPGQAALNISGFHQASSLLPMNEVHIANWKGSECTGQISVDVVRLEPYLAELRPDERVFLKIDVQGFEKQVLAGCGAELRKVQLMQVELSLVALYEGSPLLSEMVHYLSDAGFNLYDVVARVVAPDTGVTLQLDGLFIRRNRLPAGGTAGQQS
jgi:FkbM family methyltransferase